MKIRLLSAIVTVASIAGVALAQRGDNTRVMTLVRDNSGQPVQNASVKFFGPFGSNNRRGDYSVSTNRYGEVEQMLSPGRYLVFASDENRGSTSTTYVVSDRTSTGNLDLRLRTTRRPTIQFVLMSDDRNEPISNANIEVFTNETGKRDSFRSRGEGITQYEIPGSMSGGRFELAVTSRDFDTVTKTLNFRPRTDTSNTVVYIQMRRKTGLRNDNGTKYQRGFKLDGLIRLTNKDRNEAGDMVPVYVGLLMSDTQNLRGQGSANIEVLAPNGSRVYSKSQSVELLLNEYASSTHDVRTTIPGVYTVVVSATGQDSNRWDGKFTFNVQPRSGNRANPDHQFGRGDYLGMADIETDNRSITSHELSVTLTRGVKNSDDVKGWLEPRRGSGFRISFKGTYDLNLSSLKAIGTMDDRSDKRWEILLTGSPDRNGKISARLSIRALDNSYNRTFNFTLATR